MVNRISGLFSLISNNEWLKLNIYLNNVFIKSQGIDWDKPEPDTKEIEYVASLGFDNHE